MDARTREWLELLSRALLWAAALVLALSMIGVVQVLAADSLPIFEDFQEQSRGAVAVMAFGGGITAAGILSGLGAILRCLLEPRPVDG